MMKTDGGWRWGGWALLLAFAVGGSAILAGCGGGEDDGGSGRDPGARGGKPKAPKAGGPERPEPSMTADSPAAKELLKDMVPLQMALEQFDSDCGSRPTGEESLGALLAKPQDQALAKKWKGPYLAADDITDHWDRMYVFMPVKRRDSGELEHAVWSAGDDGKPYTKDDVYVGFEDWVSPAEGVPAGVTVPATLPPVPEVSGGPTTPTPGPGPGDTPPTPTPGSGETPTPEPVPSDGPVSAADKEAMTKGKAKLETDLPALVRAMQRFELDVGRAPTEKEGLNALRARPKSRDTMRVWGGPYLKAPRLKDFWGRPYVYLTVLKKKDGKKELAIWSAGPDGKPYTRDDVFTYFDQWTPPSRGRPR